MSLIASEFSKQPDPGIRSLVKDQVCYARMSELIQSSKGRSSISHSVKHVDTRARHFVGTAHTSELIVATFLELELNLKVGFIVAQADDWNSTSLQECLEQLRRPEVLDGDNKYNCPKCRDLRTAGRRTVITFIPPVIHFSLMRFVFDQKSMSRKKSKASISYPGQLEIVGGDYELRGVVTHVGTSVSHSVRKR